MWTHLSPFVPKQFLPFCPGPFYGEPICTAPFLLSAVFIVLNQAFEQRHMLGLAAASPNSMS